MEIFAGYEHSVLTIAALFEIAFGLLLVVFWRARVLLIANIVGMVLLACAVAMRNGELFAMQFNPATLNLAMIALSLVGLIAARELPSARRCLRREDQAAP